MSSNFIYSCHVKILIENEKFVIKLTSRVNSFMHKYDSYSHSKFSIKYHIILSVKYHRKMLMPIINDIKKSFDRAAIG